MLMLQIFIISQQKVADTKSKRNSNIRPHKQT